MDQNFTTVNENEVLLLQLGLGLAPPFFEFRETLSKTIEKSNIHGIKGLNFSTTNILTIFDAACPMKAFNVDQKVGLSYTKKFNNGVELSFGGSLIENKTVFVPVMLKNGRYGLGGEFRLDLTDPMAFIESGLHIVCQLPMGKIDLILKLRLGLTGINKVIVQLRKTIKESNLDPPKYDFWALQKLPTCTMFLTITPDYIIEEKVFNSHLIQPSQRHGVYCMTSRAVVEFSRVLRRNTRRMMRRSLRVILCGSCTKEGMKEGKDEFHGYEMVIQRVQR